MGWVGGGRRAEGGVTSAGEKWQRSGAEHPDKRANKKTYQRSERAKRREGGGGVSAAVPQVPEEGAL